MRVRHSLCLQWQLKLSFFPFKDEAKPTVLRQRDAGLSVHNRPSEAHEYINTHKNSQLGLSPARISEVPLCHRWMLPAVYVHVYIYIYIYMDIYIYIYVCVCVCIQTYPVAVGQINSLNYAQLPTFFTFNSRESFFKYKLLTVWTSSNENSVLIWPFCIHLTAW